MQAGDVVYDLGSGAGRFVAQACLAIPGLRGVGVELAESRHAVAAAAEQRPGWPPLASARHADILHTPMDECTHVYFASVAFDDTFMAKCGAKLAELPRLTAVATLRRFPNFALERSGFKEDLADEQVCVEVTWGVARCYVYRRS